MQEIQDHLVYFPEGFYDMQRYPERIEHGGKRTVTKTQFRQMQNSDPSVELRQIVVPQDILARLVTKARAEKAAKEAADMMFDEVVPADHVVDSPAVSPTPTDEPRHWEPIGWYKGQLRKNDGMEGIDA